MSAAMSFAGNVRYRCSAYLHLAGTGMAFYLAYAGRRRSAMAQSQRLTIPKNGAQHAERAAVFYYSKVKDDPFRASESLSKRAEHRNVITSHLLRNEPPACDASTATNEMEQERGNAD